MGRSDASPSEAGAVDAYGEAFLGAAASAGACLLSNPIDIIRVRLQLASANTHQGGVAVARSLFMNGGMRSGLPAAMAYNVILNGTRFSLFHALDSEGGILDGRPMSSGLLAGSIAGLLASPLARLRTIQQAGTVRTATCALRELAVAPFAGATVWSLRNAGHTATIFALYRMSMEHLETSTMSTSPTALHLASSLFAASASCLLMNPLDVLATRAFHTPPKGVRQRSALRSAIPSVLPLQTVQPSSAPTVSAAVATAYRGLGANLLRTVPHTVLTFVFVELLRGRASLVGRLTTDHEQETFERSADHHAPRRRLALTRTSTLPSAFGGLV